MANVAFIGLGTMDYPMAEHLNNAGHAVMVFNYTPATAERWRVDYRGHRQRTPADAARETEFVAT